LQGQITLATGCPGLLLYGRRRMGKSTLLKNLPPFLPGSIAVASLSMQGPRAFGSLGQWALAELEHAEWSSWFVSLRTVELLPFSEAETRLLLTEPMRYSELWQYDDASRPRFDAAFWGEGGIERIHHETAGWPHLVQLLAERAVYLVNRKGLPACTLEILDEAIATAIASGDAVLRQLVCSESRHAGEWEYLKRFRIHDFQEPPADEAVYQSLRRRLMVTEEDGHWRMRVPLAQRWLRERG
jgi:hypothetical protein